MCEGCPKIHSRIRFLPHQNFIPRFPYIFHLLYWKNNKKDKLPRRPRMSGRHQKSWECEWSSVFWKMAWERRWGKKERVRSCVSVADKITPKFLPKPKKIGPISIAGKKINWCLGKSYLKIAKTNNDHLSKKVFFFISETSEVSSRPFQFIFSKKICRIYV